MDIIKEHFKNAPHGSSRNISLLVLDNNTDVLRQISLEELKALLAPEPTLFGKPISQYTHEEVMDYVRSVNAELGISDEDSFTEDIRKGA